MKKGNIFFIYILPSLTIQGVKSENNFMNGDGLFGERYL